jgi:hypothetical protein
MRPRARSISTCRAVFRRIGRSAAYFAAWLDRVIADAQSRTDYRNERERQATLDYLRKAREHFSILAR